MQANTRIAVLFFLPAALFMGLFLIFPLLLLVRDSLFDVNLISTGEDSFVGLANYWDAITSSRFLGAAWNTVIYVVGVVLVQFLLGLGFAMLLNVGFKGSGIVRTIFLSPLMIAPLVSGLIWSFMLSEQFGIVNEFLVNIGVIQSSSSILWLSDPKYSLLSAMIADIWIATPFMMLVLLAGLQGIPKTYYEAAEVDGANKWRQFINITLPSLVPVMIVAVLIRVVDAARTFDIVWVLTQGGPVFSSEVLSTYMYKNLTRYGLVGESSAMAVLFIIMLIAVSSYFIISMFKANKK